MWRKILNITSWIFLAAYLGASLWLTDQTMSQIALSRVQVVITDSIESHFITPAEITGTLSGKGIPTNGIKLDELNRDLIKNNVKTIPGVKDALVFSTPEGTLHIQVWQRTPIMRFIGPQTSYYIDSDGKEMALSENYSARVLMVTGEADKNLLKDSLFRMVKMIRSDAFLDALIEEIAVNPDHSLEIIPRIGDHRIFFGDADNFEWKLIKLKVFYEKGLPNVGWGRYSKVDLRYSNQVVAKKWSVEEKKMRDSVWPARDTAAGKKTMKKV